jgi:hypothetical protein
MAIKKKIYDIRPPRNWKNNIHGQITPEADFLKVHKVKNNPVSETTEESTDFLVEKNNKPIYAFKEKFVSHKSPIVRYPKETHRLSTPTWLKKSLIPAGILVFLVLLYILGFVILPKATVNINTVKTPGIYNTRVLIATADGSAGVPQTDTLVVPAILYVVNNKESQEFLATGNKIGGTKAKVTLKIYNNYSTSPQILVAGTRFQAEGGKIFRLDSRLVIPPAKLDNQNKLIAVYIETTATADEAGDSYNIPAGKFTIPGFSDPKKSTGFYATSDSAASGGSMGGLKSVTTDDLKNAETKVGKDLLNDLDNGLKIKIPADYKILEGAKNYKMQQIESTAKVDQVTEKFTVTMSGEVRVVAFKESDLLALIKTQLQKQVDANTDVYGEPSLEYTISKTDFTKGSLTGQVKVNWSSRPLISAQEIITNLRGKTINTAKTYLESIPNMKKTSVKLWPGYIQRIPANEQKISVTID